MPPYFLAWPMLYFLASLPIQFHSFINEDVASFSYLCEHIHLWNFLMRTIAIACGATLITR